MLVVADASPLILLGRLGCLHLLQSLFDRVVMPREVFLEITSGEGDLPGSQAVRKAGWLEVVEADEETALQASLRRDLDQGEAAAIALAKSLAADLLLIDERQGRSVAESLGLEVKGTLGALLMAKNEGLVDPLRPVLERLRQEGAWISDDLLRVVFEAAGEVPGESTSGH